MKIYRITYSITGKHTNELKQILGLQSVSRIVDISDSLIAARKHINPFRKDTTARKTSHVVLISDYPLTGKSCLAFNLARNWLDASIAFAGSGFSVVIIKPEWQSNWKREKLQNDIEAYLEPAYDYINTLVIIDDLENIATIRADAYEILSWLLEPLQPYHKLLIHNEGDIGKLFMQNSIQDYFDSDGHESLQHILIRHMAYSQDDITKLIHLDRYLESSYFQFEKMKAIKDQASNILRDISITRRSNTNSYLVGLISPSIHSEANSKSLRLKNLQKSNIFRSLQENYQAQVLLNILIQLHLHWELSRTTGHSYELVGRLYIEVAKSGWPEYQQIVSILSKANLTIVDNDSIYVPDLFFDALISSSILEETYSLEEYFTGMQLRSCNANLQLGTIHLNKTDYANALSYFSKCTNTATKKLAVEYLAQHIWDVAQQQVIQSIESQHIQERISSIIQHLCAVFASVSPKDIHKRYRDALDKLQDLLANQQSKMPDVDELNLLRNRLIINIDGAKQFGDDDTKRSERNKIIYQLDKRSHQSFDISFYHLCALSTPTTLSKLLEQLECLRDIDKTGLLQLVVDHVILKLCEYLKNKSLQTSYNNLFRLAEFGSYAKDFLFSCILDELLLADSDEIADTSVFFQIIPQKLEQNLDLGNIIGFLLFRNGKYSQDEKTTIGDNILKTLFTNIDWDASLLITQDIWFQSVEAVLTILDNEGIRDEHKKEWLNSIFDNINPYTEEKIEYSNALLLTFALDVIFSFKANKTNVAAYLEYLLEFIKLNTLFQFYCAVVARFLSENKNYFVFELLAHNILELGIKSVFSVSYQIGLASYILWLRQICLQSPISQSSTELINEHIECLHKSMEGYSEAFYVRDKLQWGQNYRNVVTSLENTLTESLELGHWQESVSVSYVKALRVYSSNGVWDDISLLKTEGSAFCEIHKIENDAYSILKNYEASPNSREQRSFRDPKRSELYGLNKLQWDQVIRNMQIGRFADSINYLNRNLHTYQTKFEFWYLLGLSYLKMYDDLSAMNCFYRSLQLAPTYINAYLQIAHIHNKLEHTELEIETLSKAYLIDSNHFDVVFRLAKAHQKQEPIDGAIKYYEHAVGLVHESTPDYQAILRELVILYKHKAQWEQALDWCWKALRHSNTKHEWLLELQDIVRERTACSSSLTYFSSIQYEPIVNYLILCLQETETPVALVGKIATAYFRMGSVAKAWESIKESSLDISTMAQIMSDAQYDEDALFYKGIIYYQQEKYEEAVSEWVKVLQKCPDDYETLYYFSLANFAAAKINSKLKLSKTLVKSQLELATESAFAALYYGQSRTKAWKLLGNIYLLLGKSNSSFYTFSSNFLEESCIETPHLELIVTMAQVKLAQFIGNFPHGETSEIQSWLNTTRMELVDWLQSYIELSRKSYSPIYLNHYLGSICLQICQLVRQNVEEDIYHSLKLGVGVYFRIAHKALSSIVESNNDKFSKSRALMGDLYWEWHFLIESSEGNYTELKSAIQHWEKAQELQQKTKVSRYNRTLREELEISIGSARKKIKKLSKEST